jgi:hypothetical protein
MTAYALGLSDWLHAVIQEARARAKRRRVLLAAVVLVIALCATGAALGLAGSSGRPTSSPFGSIEGSQGAGEVVTGSIVHFRPNAHFWVGLGLANLSDRTVIVTNVQAVEPPHSFVHQTGTALLHWYVPPPCRSGHSCLPAAEGFTPQPVTAVGPPRPLEVKPGNGEWRLGVQLNFVTGTCAELTSPTAKSPSHLLITFHVPHGPTERETVRLGRYRLYRQRAHASWVCPPQR